MFQVQYKQSSMGSICGMLFITTENYFCLFLQSEGRVKIIIFIFFFCGNQQHAIDTVDGVVLVLSLEQWFYFSMHFVW